MGGIVSAPTEHDPLAAQARIGHNRSPFDDAADAVDSVWTEAQHWLTGATASTQAEADAIGQLLDMARQARKIADEARVLEKKPHDEAAAAVQARYRPLLSRCDAICDAAKKALQPFLAAQEAAKREREREAREAAEAARREAQAAFATAQDLAERDAAEAAAEKARIAEIQARAAAKDTGRARGGARAISLRTRKEGRVTDLRALMAWVWRHDRSALIGFAATYVAGAVRAGQTDMDGVEIVEVEIVA